ncbi:MAG: VWA domain-containing protein [Planctomycetota bacterium]|jgi:hypothetical protein
MSANKRLLMLAAAIALAVLYCGVARGESDEVKKFKKTWAEAGRFVANQVGAVKDLLRFPSGEAAQVLLDYVFQPKVAAEAKDAAFKGLVRMRGYSDVVKVVRENATESKSWQARAACCRMLGQMEDEDCVVILNKCIFDKHWQVQLAAAQAVVAYRQKSSVAALIEALQKAEGRLAHDIMDALRKITNQTGLERPEDWKNWWDSNKEEWTAPLPPEEGSYEEEQQREAERGEDGSFRTYSEYPIYGTEVGRSKAIIFVIDTSGSMRVAGMWGKPERKITRLEAVKKELKQVIDNQLSKDARFNIVTFGSEIKPWKTKLVKASSSSRKNAKKFIDSLKPDGMTNTYAAIKQCYADNDVDTVYFLSDGCPTIPPMSVEEILSMVRGETTNRGVVFHTIAFLIGKGEEYKVIENKSKMKRLMRDLAGATGGNYKEIE